MSQVKPRPGSQLAPYASPAERYAAQLRDGILGSVLVFGPVAAAFALGREGLGLALLPIGYLAAMACELIGTAVWGQTFGKWVQGIKVVRVADGEVPGFGPALRRLGWEHVIFPIGVLLRSDHRGLHDRRAGTAVVRIARPKLRR